MNKKNKVIKENKEFKVINDFIHFKLFKLFKLFIYFKLLNNLIISNSQKLFAPLFVIIAKENYP